MKKTIFTLLFSLLILSTIHAGPVDLAKARQVAGQFAQTTLGMTAKADAPQLVMTADAYFVFNIGASGFVIVSNDDVFRPVVGYSTEGVFPTENPSPEMMYYLDHLSRGREATLKASLTQTTLVAEEWSMLLKEGKLPSRNGQKASSYLCATKWNQNDPYNKYAPHNSYAGCVATAMSQIMNYWKHPSHGYGSHSYTHYNYGVLSANFAEAYYDFDKMPNSISNTSPAENVEAIAKFMYHCGIAVDMNFSPSGSGAYSQDVPEAIMKYFDYSNRCRHVSRDAFSLKEFQDLLKDQIDLGWPCYYSGQDANGSSGHAFVCDGYDDLDMFHFNWGWSGSGDGFFAIDELNVSSYAFNVDQAVLINYVPTEVFDHAAKAPEFFSATPNGDDEFTVTLSWTNPTLTMGGRPLEKLDQILVMRDGKTVHVIDNPVPGEAMTYVDPAGLPVMVDYAVCAVVQGVNGRKAHVDNVNLGPTCAWTMEVKSSSNTGWEDAGVSFINSAGLKVGTVTKDDSEDGHLVQMPQGRVTFTWNAPHDSTDVEINILDADNTTVFSYSGPSTLMPQGIFFETVNTCGGEGRDECPTELQAEVQGEDVLLNWKGINNHGYGYNIYRDGTLYYMVADTTGFMDEGAAPQAHSYFVTAFCLEGETDPSNTVSATLEIDSLMPPRNFDYETLPSGKIKLHWQAPENTEGMGGFMVYRRSQDSEYKTVKILAGSATSFTDNANLATGNRYYYKLVALYDNGHLESSPARYANNPEHAFIEINKTHIPSGLRLVGMVEESSKLSLEWDAAYLAETYNLYCNGELVAENLTETQYVDPLREGDLLVYRVTGVVNGVESSPSNRACYGNLAVGENTSESMQVFPNPTNGMVTVVADGLRAVEVYGVTGQLLLNRHAVSNEMPLSLGHLSPGVYYLKVFTQNGSHLQKLLLTPNF